MNVAELPFQIDREQIACFCRERGIRKFPGKRSSARGIEHGYDSVDYDVIWGVLHVEATKLKESVKAILKQEFPEAPSK